MSIFSTQFYTFFRGVIIAVIPNQPNYDIFLSVSQKCDNASIFNLNLLIPLNYWQNSKSGLINRQLFIVLQFDIYLKYIYAHSLM